jgi:hypothetical protein
MFAARLVTVLWAGPLGRLPCMTEQERPTRITYEDAIEAAKRGGNVDFEGRKVWVVSISARTGMDRPYSARLDLDLGNEYVVLLGYFRGGEFIEEGRERPFGEVT